MREMGANDLDWNLVLFVERYAIRVDPCDLIFVIDIEHHILRFLIHSAQEDLPDLIFICFSQYLLPNSSADISTGPVRICDVGDCVAFFHDSEIFLQRFQHWDRLVEDVVFEIIECFSLSGVLQSLALAQIDVVRKDKIDAAIVIFVVIVLVGNQIDGFQLTCITCCYHDLIRFSSQNRLILASFRIELKKISSKTITSC